MALFSVKHQIIGQIASQDLVGGVQQYVMRPAAVKGDAPTFEPAQAPAPASFATDRLRATCGKLVVEVQSVKGKLVYTVTDLKGRTLCQTTVDQP